MARYLLVIATAQLLASANVALAQGDTDIYFRQSTRFSKLAVTEREVPAGGEVRFRVIQLGDGRSRGRVDVEFAPGAGAIDDRLTKVFDNLVPGDYIAFRVGQDSIVCLADATGRFRAIEKTDQCTILQYGTGLMVEFKVYYKGRF